MVRDTLERTKMLVWPVIKKYLKDPKYPSQFSIPKKFSEEIELFWKINKTYPERKGKYLRPTLVLLTAQAMGVNITKIVKVAAAIQLSEEWILIHDDVEDKSEKRRDGPALQKMYGQELAINAGDSLHIIMWKIVNDINSPEISDEFYRLLLRTTIGQGIEQIWNNKKLIDRDKYFFIADSKSAYYSIAAPMRLGAILGGATKAQLNSITEFGLHLGRCFQLIDDILDFDQDKSEGKLTLANTEGVETAKKLAKTEAKIANEIFNKELGFLMNEPARTELKELIDFILERDY